MRKSFGDRLVASAKQAQAIARGEMRPGRVYHGKLLAPITVASDDNGSFLIAWPAYPEVTTFAVTSAQIVHRANQAIEEAIAARAAAA